MERREACVQMKTDEEILPIIKKVFGNKIAKEWENFNKIEVSPSDFEEAIALAREDERADFEKMIDEKYNENKKFWLKYHNEEDKHAEDIFYNIMRAFEELKQKLREEK